MVLNEKDREWETRLGMALKQNWSLTEFEQETFNEWAQKHRQGRRRKAADLPLDTITDEKPEISPFSLDVSAPLRSFLPFPLSLNHIDLYLNGVIPWWYLYYSSSFFPPFVPNEDRLNLLHHLTVMNKRKGPVNSRSRWRTSQKEMIRDRGWRITGWIEHKDIRHCLQNIFNIKYLKRETFTGLHLSLEALNLKVLQIYI